MLNFFILSHLSFIHHRTSKPPISYGGSDLRNAFVCLTAALFSFALLPAVWALWQSGSGNVNFFYAGTLLLGLTQVLLGVDVGYGVLRRELGKEVEVSRYTRIKMT
jgi:hypothetical protein